MISAELKDRFQTVTSIAVLTGAGVSAESGISTFRDPDGLWQKFRPEELANINAFLRNPDLVQSWYNERRRVAFEAQPNPAHRALAELETIVPTSVITQNVDNLHRRAGTTNLIELHGNILRSYCIDCQTPTVDSPADTEPELAACNQCGGLIRPDVVWFGEMLPPDAIEAASNAANNCDIFLSIGTGAEVYPAADLPLLAKRNGAFVVEMNTRETAITRFVDEVIVGPAGETLPEFVTQLKKARKTNGTFTS